MLYVSGFNRGSNCPDKALGKIRMFYSSNASRIQYTHAILSLNAINSSSDLPSSLIIYSILQIRQVNIAIERKGILSFYFLLMQYHICRKEDLNNSRKLMSLK